MQLLSFSISELCQNLQDHDNFTYRMWNIAEMCLNQASYKRYRADVDAISVKTGSMRGVVFNIRFQSFDQYLHEEN